MRSCQGGVRQKRFRGMKRKAKKEKTTKSSKNQRYGTKKEPVRASREVVAPDVASTAVLRTDRVCRAGGAKKVARYQDARHRFFCCRGGESGKGKVGR